MKSMCSALRSVLSGWLETYPNDFYTPLDMFECLVDIMDFSKLYHKHLMDLYAKASELKHYFKKIEMMVRNKI